MLHKEILRAVWWTVDDRCLCLTTATQEAIVPLNPCLLGASSNDSMPKKWNAAATMSASRTRLMNLLHCAGLQCESVTTSLQFTRFRNAKREVLSEADPPL